MMNGTPACDIASSKMQSMARAVIAREASLTCEPAHVCILCILMGAPVPESTMCASMRPAAKTCLNCATV
eukprot:9504964-Alexandrium_andersonii.AAC.1